MSEEMKMSDVFDLLPVNTYITKVNNGMMDFLAIEDSGGCDCCSEDHVKYITHAINVHDANQETIAKQAEEIKSSKSQIESLLERIAGVSVSEYDEEQLDYLADCIKGELDANEECIASLKADKTKQAERIKELESAITSIIHSGKNTTSPMLSLMKSIKDADKLLQKDGE